MSDTDMLARLNAGKSSKLFTLYTMTIEFRHKVLGGTPKDPEIMAAWVRKNAGLEGPANEELVIKTAIDMGLDVAEGMSWEDVQKAAEKIVEERKTNGFRKMPGGALALSAYQIKAMIKESVNILYAGERWGKTKKGPKSFAAERVFVRPEPLIPFIRDGKFLLEPDGVEQNVAHISGPKGPMSTITRAEYVEGASLAFNIYSLNDELEEEHWFEIFTHAQENGLGSSRSLGYGTFNITAWSKVG